MDGFYRSELKQFDLYSEMNTLFTFPHNRQFQTLVPTDHYMSPETQHGALFIFSHFSLSFAFNFHGRQQSIKD